MDLLGIDPPALPDPHLIGVTDRIMGVCIKKTDLNLELVHEPQIV